MDWRRYQEMQKVVELGERYISYVDAGDGAPLVLLHGAPTWGFLFHRLLPLLQERRRVLIPDLPGYGFSDRSDRFSRSLSRQAERLTAWLEAIGVERASFVGHDVGGALALRWASLHPERVEALCLVGTAAYDALPIPPLRGLGPRLSPGAERRLARALEAGFVRPEPELIAGLLAPYTTDVGRLALARNAAALDCGETMELTPLLPRLRARTLVVWGEMDPFQPLEHARRLVRDLPSANLAVIPDASHYCLLERPEAAADLLHGFLTHPSLN